MGQNTLIVSEFLGLLRSQLAEDRGADAESTPLYLSGSVGSLFKIQLSAHGYTQWLQRVSKPETFLVCSTSTKYTTSFAPSRERMSPCVSVVST